MDSLELLYDHYKETYSLVKTRLDERNKLFILTIFMLCILSLFMVNPESLITTLSKWLADNYHLEINMEISIIQSLIWFVVLYFTIRYYQTTTYIERLYAYIHKLEKTISEFSGQPFTRESQSYLDEYPMLLDFISIIYRVIFPIIYSIILIVKIITEFQSGFLNLCLLLDFIVAFCCFLLTLFYFYFLHKDYVKEILKRIFIKKA